MSLNRSFELRSLSMMHTGVNIYLMGYSPWSAIDLISTREGCSKRYGFVYVNRNEFDLKDMRRIPKKASTGTKR